MYAHLVRTLVENPMLNGCVIRLDGALRIHEYNITDVCSYQFRVYYFISRYQHIKVSYLMDIDYDEQKQLLKPRFIDTCILQ